MNRYYNIFAVLHCGSLETPSNGTQNSSTDVVDSVATFSCDYGFRLDGSAQRSCTNDGYWNGIEATCVGQSVYTVEEMLHVNRVDNINPSKSLTCAT